MRTEYKPQKRSSGSASSMHKMSANLGESENNFFDRLTERFSKSAGFKAGNLTSRTFWEISMMGRNYCIEG